MEDAHVAILDLGAHYGHAPSPSPLHFFAVFDGHGGGSAAAFAAARLLDCTVAAAGAASALAASPGPALAAGFAALDEAFFEAVVTTAALPDSGTTALAALVCPATGALTVANAGDSRAVLCRGGRAVALSTDHRPGVPAEAARIAAAGGVVCPDGFLNAALGVARGVGDFSCGGGAGSGAAGGAPLKEIGRAHV